MTSPFASNIELYLVHIINKMTGYDDCVRCYQCGVGLKSWREGDNILEQNHKHKPSCPFLQLQMRDALTADNRNIGSKMYILNKNSIYTEF